MKPVDILLSYTMQSFNLFHTNIVPFLSALKKTEGNWERGSN